MSFLNARPLIDGLDGRAELDVRYDVPSHLLEDLLQDEVDVALCPVVDFQYSEEPLEIVPVGGIGSDGPTLTVRLFSRVPLDQANTLHADTDSHTSVILAQVVLHQLFGITPKVIPLPKGGADLSAADAPDTVLLIGDKVVTDAPDDGRYLHQLDLGGAWKELTGLPFVFAVWMARQGRDLRDAPKLLAAQRLINERRIDTIVAHQAQDRGWPLDLAREYLGRLLKYGIGVRELQAMQLFWRCGHELGLLPRHRALHLYRDQPKAAAG